MTSFNDEGRAELLFGLFLTVVASVVVGIGSGSLLAGVLLFALVGVFVTVVGLLAGLAVRDFKRGMWLGYHWTVGFVARWFSF